MGGISKSRMSLVHGKNKKPSTDYGQPVLDGPKIIKLYP
ncbi:hypothetical protein EV281_11551 [Rhizobium sp. BK418]|nr:hypothetical protein EV281_11551 [Rhizobium sp. BK418]